MALKVESYGDRIYQKNSITAPLSSETVLFCKLGFTYRLMVGSTALTAK